MISGGKLRTLWIAGDFDFLIGDIIADRLLEERCFEIGLSPAAIAAASLVSRVSGIKKFPLLMRDDGDSEEIPESVASGSSLCGMYKLPKFM